MGGDDLAGTGLVVIVIILLALAGLVWAVSQGIQWARVEIAQAQASAEASKAEAARARADAAAVREAEKTKREEIALERDRQAGVNRWIRSVALRVDAATCLPMWPAALMTLLLAAPIGFWIGSRRN